jgi:hypothetical protein
VLLPRVNVFVYKHLVDQSGEVSPDRVPIFGVKFEAVRIDAR